MEEPHKKFVVIILQQGPAFPFLAVGLAGPQFLQTIQSLSHRVLKALRIQLQFNQIVHGPVGKSLLDERKFLIAGKENKEGDGSIGIPAFFCQLQAVHNGHFDVRDD